MKQRHKLVCECEVCATANMLQDALNAWRTKFAKKLQDMAQTRGRGRQGEQFNTFVNNYCNDLQNPLLQPQTRASVNAFATMCPFPMQDVDIPSWSCVFGCCSDCPGLKIPNAERSNENFVPLISFKVYKNVIHCSIHRQ